MYTLPCFMYISYMCIFSSHIMYHIQCIYCFMSISVSQIHVFKQDFRSVSILRITSLFRCFLKISNCLIHKNRFWSEQNHQIFFDVHIKDRHLNMYILEELYCENNYCGGILLCIESRKARLEHEGDGAMKKLT